jgi:predicted TIM-barrel fold metal-dependent hydrolase
MSVHPEEGDVVTEIQRRVSDLRLKGIKLGPNYQNFDPLGREAYLVYETAQKLQLPIVFSPGNVADADGATALGASAGDGRGRDSVPGAAARDGAHWSSVAR